MNLRNVFAATSLVCCVLCSVACVHTSRFVVLPKEPSYLLQAPNAHRVPFADVLEAYNGFKPGSGWIDLRPLMELRIENAYYQAGASRRGLAGYLGTEVGRYDVTPKGLQLLSVVPMANRPADEKPVQDLIAASQTKFAYYRLYYEILFARTNGSHGSVLLGAGSSEDIKQLAADLSNPESVCHPGASHCTVFPEACSVSVEMRIVANRKTQTVVWGTRLDRVVNNPHHLLVERLYNGRLTPIQIDFRDPKALLLPLLPGDVIDWN